MCVAGLSRPVTIILGVPAGLVPAMDGSEIENRESPCAADFYSSLATATQRQMQSEKRMIGSNDRTNRKPIERRGNATEADDEHKDHDN